MSCWFCCCLMHLPTLLYIAFHDLRIKANAASERLVLMRMPFVLFCSFVVPHARHAYPNVFFPVCADTLLQTKRHRRPSCCASTCCTSRRTTERWLPSPRALLAMTRQLKMASLMSRSGSCLRYGSMLREQQRCVAPLVLGLD